MSREHCFIPLQLAHRLYRFIESRQTGSRFFLGFPVMIHVSFGSGHGVHGIQQNRPLNQIRSGRITAMRKLLLRIEEAKDEIVHWQINRVFPFRDREFSGRQMTFHSMQSGHFNVVPRSLVQFDVHGELFANCEKRDSTSLIYCRKEI